MSEEAARGEASLVEAFQRLGLFGAVLAGVLGLVVTMFCFFVPGLHFVLGPFGPFFGGLVGSRLTGGGVARIGVAVAIVTGGMTALAAALTGMLFGEDVDSGLAKAAPFIVFGYTAFFATVGAFVGLMMKGPDER